MSPIKDLHAVEEYESLITNAGWQRFMRHVIGKFIDDQQSELITSESLDPSTRLAKVRLLKELRRLCAVPYIESGESSNLPITLNPKE
jgi:hypothetical protein